jgi:hypothetical protein
MQRRGIGIALMLVLCLPNTAFADGIETRSYQTVERMGQVLVDARQEMDTALFNLSVRQHQIEQAESDRDDAVSSYGPDSRDAAVTQARYEQIKREALNDVLKQLAVMAPRFETAELSNRENVKRILQSPANFEALLRAHIKGKSNPAVMGVLVYLATRRLNQYSQELYAKTLMGKIDLDIQEVQRSLELVDSLLDPTATDTDIEAAWTVLNGDLGLGGTSNDTLDDLDMLLEAP